MNMVDASSDAVDGAERHTPCISTAWARTLRQAGTAWGKSEVLERIIMVAAATAAAGAFAFGVKAQAPEPLGFSVENDRAAVLVALEAAPAGSGDWRPARLDGGPVHPGDSAGADLMRDADHCDFDIRAHFRDGHVSERKAAELCDPERSTVVLD